MEHCALKIRIFLAIFLLNVSERTFQMTIKGEKYQFETTGMYQG